MRRCTAYHEQVPDEVLVGQSAPRVEQDAETERRPPAQNGASAGQGRLCAIG